MATLRKFGRESTLVIVAVRVPDHENDENSEMRECEAPASSPASNRRRSAAAASPRCKRCPLVLHKVHKAETIGIRGKELDKVYKRARKA